MDGVVIETGTLIAYINPGTGSLFLQLLLVSVAGGWVAFRTLLRRIRERLPHKNKQSARPLQETNGR